MFHRTAAKSDTMSAKLSVSLLPLPPALRLLRRHGAEVSIQGHKRQLVGGDRIDPLITTWAPLAIPISQGFRRDSRFLGRGRSARVAANPPPDRPRPRCVARLRTRPSMPRIWRKSHESMANNSPSATGFRRFNQRRIPACASIVHTLPEYPHPPGCWVSMFPALWAWLRPLKPDSAHPRGSRLVYSRVVPRSPDSLECT